VTRAQRRISWLVVVVLALQAVPVVREWTLSSETLWPFLSWGMYRHATHAPVQATRVRLMARLGQGALRPITSRDAGQERFAFLRWFVKPIAAGDSAAARELGRDLERRWGEPVAGIEVERVEFRITDDGLETRAVAP